MLGRVVGPLAAGRGRAEQGPPRGDLSPTHRRSCCPPKGGTAPRKAAGPSPSRTSWPRSGAARQSWNGSPRTSKEPLGEPWSRTSVDGRTLPDHVLWCLGRLGARVPLYGPANTVVPREKAERWIRRPARSRLRPGRETTDAIFALAQLARVSGDRAATSTKRCGIAVLARLEALGADEETFAPGPRVPRARGRAARPGPRRRACRSGCGSWRIE